MRRDMKGKNDLLEADFPSDVGRGGLRDHGLSKEPTVSMARFPKALHGHYHYLNPTLPDSIGAT